MLFLLLLISLLAVGVVGGLWPADCDVVADRDGVGVLVHARGLHSDLILPVAYGSTDWRTKLPSAFADPDSRSATHVSFGWGDRNFSLTTAKWKDITLGAAASALLWPTDAVLHVQPTSPSPVITQSLMRVRISDEQYQRLARAIADSFEGELVSAAPIEPPSGNTTTAAGRFYAAKGRFSLPYNCHWWTGDMMRAAGIPVGIYTPLPQSVLWHLEAE